MFVSLFCSGIGVAEHSIFINLSVENAMWLLKAAPPTKSCFDMPACSLSGDS